MSKGRAVKKKRISGFLYLKEQRKVDARSRNMIVRGGEKRFQKNLKNYMKQLVYTSLDSK